MIAEIMETITSEARSEHKRERTREQILEATRSALIRVGFEHITTRRIAEEAGVNIATLHYYFGTKEALLTEAVRFTLNRTVERLRQATMDAPDAPTAFERAIALIWEMVRERPGVLRYDLVVRGMRDPVAQTQVTAIYDSLYQVVLEILERHISDGHTLAPGMSIAVLAHYLLASVDGVVLLHLIYGDDMKTSGSFALIVAQVHQLLGSGVPPVEGNVA